MNRQVTGFLLIFGLIFLLASVSLADITDFTNWTLVEDPADPNFSASATTAQAILTASNGMVPLATDIGYKSINGPTADSSTQGYVFSPSTNFSIAIDYDWAFSGSPVGILSLGFGIGEDDDGMNSVGVVMATFGGTPLSTYTGGARVGNTDQGNMALSLSSTLAGSMFVSYDAASGDVTVGASQTPGAATPAATVTYAGIQDQWNDRDLLASFFIRSGPIQPWQSGGMGEATLSNFRVLEGVPVSVPEPSPLVALLLTGASLGAFRRRS